MLERRVGIVGTRGPVPQEVAMDITDTVRQLHASDTWVVIPIDSGVSVAAIEGALISDPQLEKTLILVPGDRDTYRHFLRRAVDNPQLPQTDQQDHAEVYRLLRRVEEVNSEATLCTGGTTVDIHAYQRRDQVFLHGVDQVKAYVLGQDRSADALVREAIGAGALVHQVTYPQITVTRPSQENS